MNLLYTGILYIVPTPIGNLSDITQRALNTLKNADIIAAESIQHTGILLKNFKIKKSLTLINKHNEQKKSNYLIEKLKKGQNIALVSNAGTPLINDPGYILVKICHSYNIKVVPLPGPCAAITALSASGISTNRFCYEGFLPSKKKMRCDLLRSLKKETRTIIFYESKHRILESIQDIIDQIDQNRHIVIAKEITKKWESIRGGEAKKILKWMREDEYRYKGEIVIIINGFKKLKNEILSEEILNCFKILRNLFPLKISVVATSKIYKIRKNILYQYALKQEK
ncbi:16S rRNA (cytidine(1402)-2'-O)-methyltransferase [Buchnera aphidicola (Muscaphis stroyani)]|uniref:Ribosomal RNA small subunit methyltransferase I n=1 Tax=Buchnera aphidicola (Muscaphis stroyani) TaxID=1241869 RepID=A0A4D6YIF4_9GAMM|nr:16S rRNA (cytidine(1402)-2'-O)-methyltransferase [Buchnera aphidicola]QCI24195.1 16S rRNA (cytidine(1402)-2'-O)-methyltransferase [Buchnera aphidicola (Muscaphis stroyani)]